MESGIREQICAGSGIKILIIFWNEGSNFWVKIWDQLRKNIPRYDPVKRPSSKCNSIVDLKGLSTTSQISFKTGV